MSRFVRNRLHRAMFERKDDNGGSGNGDGPSLATVTAEIKKLIQGQGTAFEDYKKTNDAILAKLAKGEAVGDLETKLAALEKTLQKNSEEKKALEDAVAELQQMALLGGGNGKAKDELEVERKNFNFSRKAAGRSDELDLASYQAYKAAFEKFTRKGGESLNDVERKAMLAGDDANGGYFLPPPAVGRIIKRIFEVSPVRSVASVISISGPALEGITDNDEAGCGWVGETETRSDTTTPKIGKYRLEAFEMYAQPKVSQTLLDDSAVDVEGWLGNKVASKMARLEGTAFVNGTGVGQPRGFNTYPTATTDDDTRAWGTIQFVKTGTNGGFGTNGDVLFDLIAAFRPFYLQNAKWGMRRETIAALRKLKGSVNADYLWQPGLQQGQPDRLLGYDIINMQDLPALSTNTQSLWLADWAEFYTVVDRMGIRVLRDPYTDKPNVKFYTTRRVGGGVLNFEAGKAVQFST